MEIKLRFAETDSIEKDIVLGEFNRHLSSSFTVTRRDGLFFNGVVTPIIEVTIDVPDSGAGTLHVIAITMMDADIQNYSINVSEG